MGLCIAVWGLKFKDMFNFTFLYAVLLKYNIIDLDLLIAFGNMKHKIEFAPRHKEK